MQAKHPYTVYKNKIQAWGMVVHSFNPSTGEADARGGRASEASLVYKESSRTTSTTQRDLVLKHKQTNF